jgi:hypothetical protein
MAEIIDVLFLHGKNQETGESETDVFAYFPNEISSTGPDYKGKVISFKTSYAHVGQHSACHPDYAAECKEANFAEYSDLLKELVSIGYKKLNILNSQETELHRQPTAYELKLGYGGTFWRTFKLAKCIDKKGNLKKWIKSEDDHLRYYR